MAKSRKKPEIKKEEKRELMIKNFPEKIDYILQSWFLYIMIEESIDVDEYIKREAESGKSIINYLYGDWSIPKNMIPKNTNYEEFIKELKSSEAYKKYSETFGIK